MSEQAYRTRPDRDRPAVLTVWQEFLEWTFERTNPPLGPVLAFGEKRIEGVAVEWGG